MYFLLQKGGGKTKDRTGPGHGEDSDLDLSTELQALGCYMEDREELVTQAFQAVKGEQLAAMIPDILKVQWPPLNRDTDKGEHLLIGTVCQTPINFLLMLVYVNVSSDKGEHLLIGTKSMLPDRPVYQVCTVLGT